MFEYYLSKINQCLPNFLDSFYIVGSIALEEFNSHFSDVDFVAVIHHQATSDEIEALRDIHAEVERHHRCWKLSGMYILRSEVGKLGSEVKPLLGYHDGRLNVHANFESNPITWWILRNSGISLLGSNPCDLSITIDPQVLVVWTLQNMNTYWKSWTQHPGRLIALLTDWGIQWTVLGVLRQFYTIREKKIITKQRAGDYALSVISQSWHPIIKEAIRIRTKTKGSLYRSKLVRARTAVLFVKYILRISNDYEEAIE